MIVVAEPTYRDREHAAVNGSILRAISLAVGPVLFAATPAHQTFVAEALRTETLEGALPSMATEPIEVMAPGGVHLGRMCAQWRTLSGLVRQHRPSTMVLLSAGPETLFVARLLVARHRALRLFVVMHGNLGTATGWRSRDLRRRLIDMRSALRVSRHPRIRLIVLETHIPAAAAAAGLGQSFLVWPHPSNQQEHPPPAPWSPPDRLRLTFVGTANRQKGFDQIVALQREAGAGYEWAVAGALSQEFSAADAAGFDVPPDRLSRIEFLAAVQRADYAVLSFGAEYAFIASGSLMDCISQRKPLIAVTNILLAQLQAAYGPIGYVCADHYALAALLRQPERLRDDAAYASFQNTLDKVQAGRLPSTLAHTIRRDLGA